MLDFSSWTWKKALHDGMGARLADLPGGRMIACFRAGPFRIAYPDFLIGSAEVVDLDSTIYAARHLQADMVRLQTKNALLHPDVQAAHRLGSVLIDDLQSWSERSLEKARRAANRQLRSPLRIRKGLPGDGPALHALYCSTLQRQGGTRRYTANYFELIAPHAALVAELDGVICAFVCAGFMGSRACYMHGSHSPTARGHYPSDQLFLAMLRNARDLGIERFDFLATPPNQPSLAAYKRAWGGSDAPLVVNDLALRPLRSRGIAVAMKMQRMLTPLRRL